MSQSKSIVHELQDLASSSNSDILSLLRKSLIVSTKLEISDFKEWVKSELNGYAINAKLPTYRIVKANLKAENPYSGFINVRFDNRRMEELFTKTEIYDPISSLLESAQSKGRDGGVLALPFNADEHQIFYSMQASLPKYSIYRIIGDSDVANIVDNIKTTILEWSLKLESDGILGDGMLFSIKEKEIAQMNNHINIQNFQGVLGDINNSEVTQNLKTTIEKNNKELLSIILESKGVSREDIITLEEALDIDPIPGDESQFGENVRNWIKHMTHKAIDGSWTIGLAAAGNLLSSSIATYYGLPK